MPHSRLHIEIAQSSEEDFRASGQDRVDFRFTANRGQEPQPIGTVASGGELSRLMLALKSLLELGRASCRERVLQSVSVSVAAVTLTNKNRVYNKKKTYLHNKPL